MKKAPKGHSLHSAFTMIELIFVIIILGVLAAVALPKFADSKNQAEIANGRAEVSSIRTAIINERQSRLILGESQYITALSVSPYSKLFEGNGTSQLLTYGLAPGNWARVDDTNYTFTVDGVATNFSYFPNDNGKFTCVSGTADCDKLVN